MKKNNAGVTLVEVIVVIAMIAIFAGTGIYGIGQINGFRAREGADTIANSLTQARVAMLGKAKSNGNIAWEIYCKDSKYYVRTVYNAGVAGEYYRDEKKIADGALTVTLGTATYDASDNSITATSVRTLENNENFRVYFNRATGAMCDSTGAEMSGDRYFRVKQGRKDYDVLVIAKTGKIISQTVKR